MIYSATAAVHAIILLASSSTLPPGEDVFGDIYNSVLVEGNASFGDTPEGIASQWNYSQWYASKRINSLYYMDTDSLWLPVFPKVWDYDSAPVLAIVGTAFLMVLSMQMWSNTSKKSDAKAVIFLWSGLLFSGSICALINAASFAGYSTSAIPQLRFCPPNLNDTLPLNSGSTNDLDARQHAMDPYFWNRTVWATFQNSSGRNSNACLYPCFSSSWPLKDQTEILVESGITGEAVGTVGGSVFSIIVSVFVLWSAIASLVILMGNVTRRPRNGLKESSSCSDGKDSGMHPTIDTLLRADFETGYHYHMECPLRGIYQAHIPNTMRCMASCTWNYIKMAVKIHVGRF